MTVREYMSKYALSVEHTLICDTRTGKNWWGDENKEQVERLLDREIIKVEEFLWGHEYSI